MDAMFCCFFAALDFAASQGNDLNNEYDDIWIRLGEWVMDELFKGEDRRQIMSTRRFLPPLSRMLAARRASQRLDTAPINQRTKL